jgi:hypothetical protein
LNEVARLGQEMESGSMEWVEVFRRGKHPETRRLRSSCVTFQALGRAIVEAFGSGPVYHCVETLRVPRRRER